MKTRYGRYMQWLAAQEREIWSKRFDYAELLLGQRVRYRRKLRGKVYKEVEVKVLGRVWDKGKEIKLQVLNEATNSIYKIPLDSVLYDSYPDPWPGKDHERTGQYQWVPLGPPDKEQGK